MMNCNKIIIILLPFFLFNGKAVSAQVWQWSMLVKGAKEGGGTARAFLWIPPDCSKVKGVVIAQNNMEEISILGNHRFRNAMSDLGFAEIWVSPSFDHLFNFKEGAGETFDGMMRDLANSSGYEELRYAPVVAMGHSAAASWPYYFAAWNPARTLAAISVSGQWPYFRSPVFAPDIWSKKQNIDFIPCLETMGEYEAANTWSFEGLNERQQHPLMPLTMLACPAEGHFATMQKKIDFIAFYIKKAAQYRLPKNIIPGVPPKLIPINPGKTGWLADKWRYNEKPTASAAPFNKYTGDKSQAFWFFDKETVTASEKYQSAYRNMKADLLGYIQDGKVVPQRNTHQQVDLIFQPQKDGITFTLMPTFLDTVPGAHIRTSEWTGLPVGSPVGHAKSGGPIVIDKVSGPFTKVGNNTFAIHMERGAFPNLQSYQLWFAAKHPGDKIYKPAIQQARMNIPARNTEGIEQHILFPTISDQKQGTPSIKLSAISDAHVPVYYYVLEGPAEIKGTRLLFTKIPPKAKFPVKVTIVAWQYGSSIEPKLKTAEPMERTFYIIK